MQKIKKNKANKTYVLIFEALDMHLTKDVGSIPYVLARDYKYDSYLVCHDIGQEFANEYVLRFLKIIKIKPIKYLQSDDKRTFYILSYLLFLIKNAKNIDVIQFYHNTVVSRLTAFAYKLLNPKGFVYLKLDAGHYAAEEKKYKLNFIISLKKSFKTIVRKIFEKSLDLISTETYNAFNAYKLSFPERKNKIIHIPNGIDFKFLKSLGVEHSQKTDKENLIITVARIGIKEKNNQMMLNALNGLEMKDWKFAFIGPIEHSFDSEIKAFYSQNPQLIEKVIFTGAISNRKELYSWYGKAKAFCLTSPSESFCIAMSDSLYFGCEIISTPVISFDDITNKNEFGYKIRDVDDLRDVLKRIIDGRIDICVNFEKIVAYSKRFDWTDICEKLDKRFGGRN